MVRPRSSNDMSSFSQLSSYDRGSSLFHDPTSLNETIVSTKTGNGIGQRTRLESQESIGPCEHCRHYGTDDSRTCKICDFARNYDPSCPFDPQSMAILSSHYSTLQESQTQTQQLCIQKPPPNQQTNLRFQHQNEQQTSAINPNNISLSYSFSNPSQNGTSNVQGSSFTTGSHSPLTFNSNMNATNSVRSNNREENNNLEDESYEAHYNFYGSNNSQEVEAFEQTQERDSIQELEHESDEEAEGSEDETTTTLVHEILNFCATYRPDLLAHAHDAKSSLLSLASSNSNAYTVQDREHDRSYLDSRRMSSHEYQGNLSKDSDIGGGVGDSTTALSCRFASVSSFRASLSSLSLEEMMNAVTVAYEQSIHPVLATNIDLTHRRENLTPSILPLVSEITATRLSPRVEQYDDFLNELESGLENASESQLDTTTFSVPFFEPPAEHSSLEKFLSYTEEQYDWNRLFSIDASTLTHRRTDQGLIAESNGENSERDSQEYSMWPAHDYDAEDAEMYVFE